MVIAAAMPLLPGKGEEWRRWTQELQGSRQAEYAASRKRLGIHFERCWTGTIQGVEFVLAYLEVEDSVQMCMHLVNSWHPFDCWYRKKLQELHGLDFTQQQRSFLLEETFTWQRPVPASVPTGTNNGDISAMPEPSL